MHNPLERKDSTREISRSLVTRRKPMLAAFENGTSTVMLLQPNRNK
jgi:hypothetical protein